MTIEQTSSAPPTLSERELEVLRLVATGATNNQVARELSISVNTVKVHLNNIFTKLGVQSRTEATLYAVRRGWVHVARGEGGAAEIPTTGVGDPAVPELAPPTGGQPELPTTDPARDASALAPAIPTSASPVLPLTDPASVPLTLPAVSESRAVGRRWQGRALALVAALALISLVVAAFASNTQAWKELFGPRAAGPASPAASPPVRWQVKSPLAAPREAMAVAAAGNLVYVIDGITAGQPLSDVSVYDAQADQWSSRAAKPTPLQANSAAVVGGRIYVPGGCDANNQPSSVMEIYDPQRDEWQVGVAMPHPLCHYALSTVEGKLYLFGGWDGSASVADVLVFDPGRGLWSSGPAMPSPRADAAAALVNDRIYVVGGRDGSKLLNQVLVFDPSRAGNATGAWQTVAPMLHPRAGLGLAALAGNLYAFGGGWSSMLVENERYDTRANSWSALEDAPKALWRVGGIATLETRLYLIGGFDGAPTSAVQEYTALYRFFLPSAPGGP